jgi:phosphohistidine phosphatase
MKTLFVVRHAKSSWEDISMADFDRPLNDRGQKDAPRMAKRLKGKNIRPDLILTSPANRALTTCKRMAEILGYAADKIKIDRHLYHASEDEILSVISSIKDTHDSVMIFGHNPGLTEFVNILLHESHYVEHIPTCGVVAIVLDINSWTAAKSAEGKFLFFDFPKSKDD